MSNAEFDKESFHKEIDLIQACITRMAHNSFLLKGWAVTLSVGIIALADKSVIWHVCLIALAPLICFWYLDAFFLRTERMYRQLYNDVIKARPEGDQSNLFDLNPHRYADKVPTTIGVMRSQTLLAFYGIPILVILTVALVSMTGCWSFIAPAPGTPSEFIRP